MCLISVRMCSSLESLLTCKLKSSIMTVICLGILSDAVATLMHVMTFKFCISLLNIMNQGKPSTVRNYSSHIRPFKWERLPINTVNVENSVRDQLSLLERHHLEERKHSMGSVTSLNIRKHTKMRNSLNALNLGKLSLAVLIL